MKSDKSELRVYMDHAAATPVDQRVIRAMKPFWSERFANPSAIHREGVAARVAIKDARTTIAELLGIHADEVVFTGSGTESCNMALSGTVNAWQSSHPGRTPHVIVSAIEHDAVLEPSRRLEASGVCVTRLPVQPDGIVNLSVLKNAINEDTVTVSVMYANNEIGTIQPIRETAKIIRKWKKEAHGITRIGKPDGDDRYPLMHTDATQAANYLDLHIPYLGVDLLTMNAAKIYGPRGVGLLAILRGTPIEPIVVGGGQERGFRAGTENVAGIVGFAKALAIAQKIADKESRRLTVLRNDMIAELKRFSGLSINGSEIVRLPNNVNFSIRGIDHEFLALQLDANGIAVATKSACSEGDAEASHVLLALRKVDGTNASKEGIRITFGRSTTKKEIGAFLLALRSIQKSTHTFEQHLSDQSKNDILS